MVKKKPSEYGRGYNPAVSQFRSYGNERRERMRGNPGIWATKSTNGGWDVHSLAGTIKTGVSEDKARRLLKVLRIRGKLKEVSSNVDGDSVPS